MRLKASSEHSSPILFPETRRRQPSNLTGRRIRPGGRRSRRTRSNLLGANPRTRSPTSVNLSRWARPGRVNDRTRLPVSVDPKLVSTQGHLRTCLWLHNTIRKTINTSPPPRMRIRHRNRPQTRISLNPVGFPRSGPSLANRHIITSPPLARSTERT